MSPNQVSKSLNKSNIGSGVSPLINKPSSTFEFQQMTPSLSSTTSQNVLGLKMKPMKMVEQSISGTPINLKFEEIKLPNHSALSSRISDQGTNFNPLGTPNILPFDNIKTTGENVKRDKTSDDGDSEGLSDITLSELDFETSDQMF
eukprot:CAMPEP_0205810646 /NCGR_PEP_ID=MMETSP0205-20121125/14821_1 /ASSEMBLY_ACC=CAM_ASM_000278 /TAXON_ID=36767 /ORGANISM="Euplotes focardii, Strain TN1" /LENGTH=145 /DNA_ID=CAMNT_0053088975 /DNA_START=53 /DNA_END=490 /DNA_ORIENTATION=-